MTRLLIFALGILVGVLACKLLCKRKTPQAVSPDPFADKMMKRNQELKDNLQTIKETRLDDNRNRRLSNGT